MPQRPLKLVKRQISFNLFDFDWLMDEAAFLGITVSELVRRAVSEKRERTQKALNEIVRRARTR